MKKGKIRIALGIILLFLQLLSHSSNLHTGISLDLDTSNLAVFIFTFGSNYLVGIIGLIILISGIYSFNKKEKAPNKNLTAKTSDTIITSAETPQKEETVKTGKINISHSEENKPEPFYGVFQVYVDDIALEQTEKNVQPNTEPAPTTIEPHEAKPRKKLKNKLTTTKIVIIALSLLLISSLAYNIVQFNTIQKNNNDINDLTEYIDIFEGNPHNAFNTNNFVFSDVKKIVITANSGAGVGDVFSRLNCHIDFLIHDNEIGQIYNVNYKVIGGVGVTHAISNEDSILMWAYGPVDDWWYNVTLPNGTNGFVWGGTNGMYVDEIE